MELTRKCKICGKNIFIERDRSTFFYDKTGFCHKDCFVEEKKNQKRPWTDDLLRAFFDKVNDTTDKKVDDLLSKKREQDHNRELARIKQEEKKILFDHIRDTYAPAVVPGSFYSKLTQLISGNYYKYRGSIPPLELYDMWVLAKPRLDKIIAEKEAKGCDMSQRWNYDLAVLLAQYPSYLERKERLASIRRESESKTKENLTEMVLKRMKTAPKQSKNENEIDINAILDEI